MEQEVQLPPQVLENLEGKSVPSKDPCGPFTVSDYHINIPIDLISFWLVCCLLLCLLVHRSQPHTETMFR